MEEKKDEKKDTVKNYFAFGEVLTYFFRKRDPNNKQSINLRLMHGINKIAIIVFLIALIIWLIKRLS